MMRCVVYLGLLAWTCGMLCGTEGARGGDIWKSYLPFGRRVEADASKPYHLETSHGPWMILASSFAGDGAEKQAHDLVIELRKSMRLEAYVWHKSFDFSKPVEGLGVDKYNNARMMKMKNGGQFVEYAVLVGDFQSVDDPNLQKTLEQIKFANPETLDIRKNDSSTQRFAGLRYLHRRINGDPDKRSRGPMGSAFVTRNPLLPDEFFKAGGVDAFVVKMNQNVEFSLLRNPAPYTVRVARFRGKSTMNLNEADTLLGRGGPSKLEVAFDQAHRMTVALRQKGVEAYEFHDRYESIVTVGGFPELGRPGPQGATEINPAIYRTMESFKPIPKTLPNGMQTLAPRMEAGLPFDLSPWPMEVPRVSVAADYARTNR